MTRRKSAGIAVGAAFACSLYFSGAVAAATANDESVARIQSALDDQRYVDASSMLEQQLVNSGDDPRLVVLVGKLNLARGRYQDALSAFKRVEEAAPVRAQAQEGEGITLSILGRSDEALVALKSAVSQNPNAWRAWNVLGSEYDRRHDWANAQDAYGHAVAASNGAALVLNNRGFSYLSQHHLDEAVADFVSALQKKPDLVQARNNLRLAMAMKGEYDRAVAGAGSADRAIVLNNAGYAAMLRGDYDSAKDLLERAMNAKGEYYAVAAANLKTTQDLAKGAGRGEHAPDR
jgi:Flp pilus assembly protein TadD